MFFKTLLKSSVLYDIIVSITALHTEGDVLMSRVAVIACEDYGNENIKTALKAALDETVGLDWVVPGMKIAIKANLVSYLAPDRAATTHPALLCELTRLLVERGAEVVVGDSPGGLYNHAFVGRVYYVTGMRDVERFGGRLNYNFGQSEASFPDAKQAPSFSYTSYLDEADAIINFCKLKSHGMMSLSCAIKNMFGVVPGTMKPEYHYRFPNHADFADMLVDLNEYFKPKLRLCLCDAVIGMEGNGPTAGTPRKIGAILASASPYLLDLTAARLIGLTRDNIPTLEAAYGRGLAPASVDDVDISPGYERFIVPDYQNITTHSTLEFGQLLGGGALGRLVSRLGRAFLRSKPRVKKEECIGCGVCKNICPPNAIKIKNGIAVIDRHSCIRCFCCQEFCPKGAMKVKRTLVARMFVRNAK